MIYIVTIGLLLISVRLYIKYLTFFQQEHYNLKKFLHHTKNFYQNDYHVLVIYLLFRYSPNYQYYHRDSFNSD
jgi:hypothetical protein